MKRSPSRVPVLTVALAAVGLVAGAAAATALSSTALPASAFHGTADPLDDDGITVAVAEAPMPAPPLGDGGGLGAQDGVIATGTPVEITAEVPAITRLDPALRAAVADAAAAASASGVDVRVSSGWRSAEYQRRLFDDAVAQRGSDTAQELVATPEESTHVSGDAVDVADLDAQVWLARFGAEWGLCRTYANESWHFELATTPGGVCPEPWADASDRY